MKNLFFISAFLLVSIINANAQNHYFTPHRNIVAKGKTTVYFVAQNPEKYDWVKWDFGDGQTEYSINPAHEYTKAGIYHVKMLVAKGAIVDTFCKNAFVTIMPNGTATETEDVALDLDVSKDDLQSFQNSDDPKLSNDLDNSSINILNSSGNSGYIDIRNLNGDVLYHGEIIANEKVKNVPIEMLNSGIYIAYLTIENKTTVKKIYKN